MHIYKLFFKFAKVVAYAGLAFFLWAHLNGPEEFAKLLGIKENFTEDGEKYVAIQINLYVLWWTFGTVILEIIDNLVGFLSVKKREVM